MKIPVNNFIKNHSSTRWSFFKLLRKSLLKNAIWKGLLIDRLSRIRKYTCECEFSNSTLMAAILLQCRQLIWSSDLFSVKANFHCYTQNEQISIADSEVISHGIDRLGQGFANAQLIGSGGRRGGGVGGLNPPPPNRKKCCRKVMSFPKFLFLAKNFPRK